MAAHPPPFCTDEELLQELKKLGYKDVPADVFLMMKEDLSQLVSKEQYNTDDPAKEHESKSDSKHPNEQASIKLPDKFPTSKIRKINSLVDDLSHSADSSTDDLSFSKYRNNLRNAESKKTVKLIQYQTSEEDKKSHSDNSSSSQDILLGKCSNSSINSRADSYVKTQENVTLSSISKMSENTKINLNKELLDASSSNGDISFSKYRKSLENFKANRYAKSRREDVMASLNSSTTMTSLSSVSIEGNKIKRKVLRHQNGKPVITEEFLEIPAIFSTSYPETEVPDTTVKSFSSEDLSFKSNSSTGSVSAVSPNPSDTPRSTLSLSSTRSVQSRGVNQRKKKTDPVAMYNYYKKFWNDFKPPGEKNHDKLRWAVRDRMLDYNL